MRVKCYSCKYDVCFSLKKLDLAFCFKPNTVDLMDLTSRITLGKREAPLRLVLSALSPLLASFDQANCYASEIYRARN